MSGGAMDYIFSRIDAAAEMVQQFRRDAAEKPAEDFAFDAKRANVDPAELKKKVLQYMDNAYVKLLEAGVYAARVEWLESDDDGYDDFIKRTDEDLEDLHKRLPMVSRSPEPYVIDEAYEAMRELVDSMEDGTCDGDDRRDAAVEWVKRVLEEYKNGRDKECRKEEKC